MLKFLSFSKVAFAILSSSLLVSGCSMCSKKKTHHNGPLMQRIFSCPEITEIVTAYSVFLEKDKRVFLEDSVVWYDKKIEKIQLLYSSQDILEINEARELLVDVTEGLIKQLNARPQILADLNSPPLSYRDLDLTIDFESDFGIYVDPMFVGMAKLNNGIAVFYAFDLKDPEKIIWHKRPEFYAQTKRMVDTRRKTKKALIKIENVAKISKLEDELYTPSVKIKEPGNENAFNEATADPLIIPGQAADAAAVGSPAPNS